MASHKEAGETVKRILTLIQEFPDAYAIREGDEKSVMNTLAAQGYKGVVGRYAIQIGTTRLSGFNLTFDRLI